MEQDNQHNHPNKGTETIKKISGMYEDWFLDYASYVILERAIPSIFDGLKPVQRRILHSLRELEDGRYNKVANVVGNTMKYHPHGDMAITDAMVQLGQKDLLIDTQGNWGNIHTGDSAAAARYIEARLSKFALEVAFNPKTTNWQTSYDGRNKEPIDLPMKFPLLLAQGVEGIAVGLSTKIMPHNFNELIDATILHLKGQSFTLYPDFITGSYVDVAEYNDGKRGGRVRIRSKISALDKNTLVISEIPFGSTTGGIIDSVIRANDRGKIKIKKIEDNTAENVEILVHLMPGLSPDKMIDALYAFTDCELSLSPNACVIDDNKPEFLTVSEILRRNTEDTVNLLKLELEITLSELQEQWHFLSLERIFIEKRIYRDIEEEETWEGVIKAIDKGLKPYTQNLIRAVTEDDITKLTEIRIKRISKFDLDKAEQNIKALEGKIEEIKHHLANLITFAIDYFKNLKAKYGKGRERRTEIRTFDTIDATKVAIANTRMYVNRAEGFIGTSLKKDEFLFECSDIDDLIVFRKNGSMLVTKVEAKTFVDKDIIHVGVWMKKDNRCIYNLIYRDGKQGFTYMKRFPVTGITRDRVYDLTAGTKDSEILYFSANDNGEAESILVQLKPSPRLKKLKFDLNFADLTIKARGVRGNLVSKLPVKKVDRLTDGLSTLAPRKIWFDGNIKRLNVEARGEFLDSFSGDDKILIISSKGEAKLINFDLSRHFEDDLLVIQKWVADKPVTCIYFDGDKECYYVKRFLLDDNLNTQTFFASENPKSFIEIISTDYKPQVELIFAASAGKDKQNEIILLEEFIGLKGLKAIGNQLSRLKIKQINNLPSIEISLVEVVEEEITDTVVDKNEAEADLSDIDGEQSSINFDE